MKKNGVKFLLSLSLALGFVLSLTACGGWSDAGSSSGSSSTACTCVDEYGDHSCDV